MPILIKSNALTFDDVLLVPQYSEVESRKDVDISTNLFGVKFSTPICSANMDTVTEATMAMAMHKLGGVGFLHRYADHRSILKWIREVHANKGIVIPSIGIKDEDYGKALDYADEGVLAVNIDIAHGDSEHMVRMVKALSNEGLHVVAGNIATYSAAQRLVDAGAKAIKVGIGPGSMCTTRIVTGHGVPQLSAIEDCARIKDNYYVKIIADGGIRNAGDCVKAIAFGADMVMVGSMLSGAKETPGDVVELRNEKGLYYKAKEYRGMASTSARSSVTEVDSTYTPEGESTFVEIKGPVENIVNQLVGGIRSGLSYSGVTSLVDLQANAAYVTITNNGMVESKPHGINS